MLDALILSYVYFLYSSVVQYIFSYAALVSFLRLNIRYVFNVFMSLIIIKKFYFIFIVKLQRHQRSTIEDHQMHN